MKLFMLYLIVKQIYGYVIVYQSSHLSVLGILYIISDHYVCCFNIY